MTAKRYYWLKMPRIFFKRHDIRIIESQPNGRAIAYFYTKLMVESVDHDGELRFNESVPYDAAMLATITNTPPEIVAGALDMLERYELIQITDDGTIVIPQAKKLIDSAVDSDSARKQQRYRDRKKAEKEGIYGDEVTECYAEGNESLPQKVTRVTKEVTKSYQSKSKSKSKSKNDRESKERNDDAGASTPARFSPPSPDDILNFMTDYSDKKGLKVNAIYEAERFFNYYSSNGWLVGRNKMKDWQSAARGWLLREDREPKPPTMASVNPFADLLGGDAP